MEDNVEKAISLIKSETVSVDIDKNILIDQLTKLHDVHRKLSPYKSKYDFKDIEHNGIRSFLNIIEQFIVKVNSDLKPSIKTSMYKRISDVAAILLVVADIQVDTVIDGHEMSNIETSQKLLSITETQYLSLFAVGHFWLPDDVQKSNRVFDWLITIGLKKWSAMVSFTARKRLMAWFNGNVNISEFKNAMGMTRSRLLEFAAGRMYPCDVVHPTVKVEITTRHQIQPDGSILDWETRKTLKLQIIRTGSDERYNGKVIFQMHGGGFVVGSPVLFQMYLRQIARALPGVTIVSPWYRLAPEHKFPAGLQDVVDAYLTVTGQTDANIAEVLGFEPTDVLVTGESAGANFALALSLVMSKLSLQVPKKILLYGCPPSVSFSRPVPSTSMFLSDPVLTPSLWHLIMDAYVAGEELDYRRNRIPWYRRPNMEDIKKRLDEINGISENQPFINPLAGDFSCFRDTKLVLVASEFDPVLDGSIEVAKSWPNDHVQLIVLKNLTHSLEDSVATRIGLEQMFEKFRELLESGSPTDKTDLNANIQRIENIPDANLTKISI